MNLTSSCRLGTSPSGWKEYHDSLRFKFGVKYARHIMSPSAPWRGAVTAAGAHRAAAAPWLSASHTCLLLSGRAGPGTGSGIPSQAHVTVTMPPGVVTTHAHAARSGTGPARQLTRRMVTSRAGSPGLPQCPPGWNRWVPLSLGGRIGPQLVRARAPSPGWAAVTGRRLACRLHDHLAMNGIVVDS